MECEDPEAYGRGSFVPGRRDDERTLVVAVVHIHEDLELQMSYGMVEMGVSEAGVFLLLPLG